MGKFKVGDRVIGTRISCDLDIEGHAGVICNIDSSNDSILVYFDERFDDMLHSHNCRCWYVCSKEIELYCDECDSEQYIYAINQETFNSLIG